MEETIPQHAHLSFHASRQFAPKAAMSHFRVQCITGCPVVNHDGSGGGSTHCSSIDTRRFHASPGNVLSPPWPKAEILSLGMPASTSSS